MTAFVVAVGLVFVIEGLIWAIFPGYAEHILKAISALPEQTVRIAGLASACLGVVIIWLVRGG